MKKRLSLLILLLSSLIVLSGCIGGGSGFDLGKFFGNPIVIILIIGLIIWFYFKRDKK